LECHVGVRVICASFARAQLSGVAPEHTQQQVGSISAQHDAI
jgi:hypothetical protein